MRTKRDPHLSLLPRAAQLRRLWSSKEAVINLRFILSSLVLFVTLCALPGTARAQIFVTTYGGIIGEYTLSGATVNASLVSGTSNFQGIAVSGGNLFVANYYGTIAEYTTSGTTVNASLVTGLQTPVPLALSGNLFVGVGPYSIREFMTSGAEVIVAPNPNANISGIPIGNVGISYGIAVSGGVLFVARTDGFGNNGAIYTYDITTGNPGNNPLVGGFVNPRGIAISGGYLFVVDSYSETIGKYTTGGATVNASLVSGLPGPGGLAVFGGHLFVTQGNGTIGEYDATTGATINAALVSGLNSPRYIDVEASPLANAGPNQTVQVGTLVTLDGSGSSDPSGQLPLTYGWSFVSQPAEALRRCLILLSSTPRLLPMCWVIMSSS